MIIFEVFIQENIGLAETFPWVVFGDTTLSACVYYITNNVMLYALLINSYACSLIFVCAKSYLQGPKRIRIIKPVSWGNVENDVTLTIFIQTVKKPICTSNVT